ncbi:MAG: methyltransferase domain-containing protein, partial [Fibromonadaceae bacterium]|nr:methyltransferase domain-containing protein [Fibromonadaceae bacterium]
FEYATGHKEEYDRIILTQVIEHVENPIEWIKALLTMLKKGGKIIVTTENKTIYPKNTIWQTDLPPVHSWWFSEKSFEYIANKLNVSINFVDFSDYISGVLFHEIGKVSYNQHIFDKNGEVFAICPLLTPPGIFSRSRAFIKRFSFVRYIYSRFWKNRVWFGKRRRIMGVIFEKVI